MWYALIIDLKCWFQENNYKIILIWENKDSESVPKNGSKLGFWGCKAIYLLKLSIIPHPSTNRYICPWTTWEVCQNKSKLFLSKEL